MSQARFVYSPHYYADLEGHVFRAEKYSRLHDRLATELRVRPEHFVEPQPLSVEDIELVHTPAYTAALLEARPTESTLTSELPLSPEIVAAFRLNSGGTLLAGRLALRPNTDGLAMNIGGGFHHAFPDHAEGFCLLNDVAIAIRRLQADHLASHVTVVDLDLHQGNGTAFIFAHDPRVFTFSMHQQKLYPTKQRSNLDIGLAVGVGDNEYLDHLRRELPIILDEHQPQLVFYLAGADPFQEDQLGDLKLTLAGLRERDWFVYRQCRQREIPVATVLAGGYAVHVEDTVQIHFQTCDEMLKAAEL